MTKKAGSRRKPTNPADEALDRSNEIVLGPLRDALGFNLRIAQEASFRAFAKRVGDANLKPRRYAILTIIHENPGLTQADLGRASGREKSSITPALKDLIRRGLVERRGDPNDGRVRTLRLTREGVALTMHLRKQAKSHDEFLEASIGRDNRELFIRLLMQLEEACARYAVEE